MTDERESLPSCSGLQRIRDCGGSFLAELPLPRVETKWSGKGDDMHLVLAKKKQASKLSHEDQETIETCERLSEAVCQQTLGCSIAECDEVIYEQRLWLKENGKKILSGQFDRLLIKNNLACVQDFKTIRPDVEDAPDNMQLRGLAVLVHDDQFHLGLDEVYTAVIAPWISPQTTLCRYTPDDLATAYEEVKSLAIGALVPGQPRMPGESQCRYCRAAKALSCPEFVASGLAIQEYNNGSVSPQSQMAVLSAFSLGELLNRLPLAEAVIDAARTEAKRRLEAGEEVSGWKLKEGAIREIITDATRVYGRFEDLGGHSTQFLTAVTVAKGKLKDALRQVTELKGKKLDDALDALLDGCTESKQNSPSLVRVAVKEVEGAS